MTRRLMSQITNIGSLILKKQRFLIQNLPKRFVKITSTSNIDNNDKHTQNSLVKNKINEFVFWYEDFTGLAEVKMCQDRVIDAQGRLLQIQEQRRKTNDELISISKTRSQLQDQLLNISKGDSQYVVLVTQEHKLIQQERNVQTKLADEERQEREIFSYLSNTIRDSHEKQRLQADRTKYWSVYITMLSAFITYLLTLRKNSTIIKDVMENINKDLPHRVDVQPVVELINKSYNEEMKIISILSEKITSLTKQLSGSNMIIDKNQKALEVINNRMKGIELKLEKNHKDQLNSFKNINAEQSWSWKSFTWGALVSAGSVLTYLSGIGNK